MNKIISEQSDWDEILGFIKDQNLTPVIGKEMYKFKQDDKLIPIDEYLSQKLLESNKVTDQPPLSLSEAVNFLENEKRIKPLDIRNKLKTIVQSINFDFPELAAFLSITELNYYINTAVYNNIFENNLKKSRNNSGGSTDFSIDSINFSLSESLKDSGDLKNLIKPFVFNVFGSLLDTVDPALSEEDMLEYTGTFNEKMSDLHNIINALKNRNLLFMGCAFPDWMVRFILRILSNEPMHVWGDNRKIIIVNDQSDISQGQYNFLKNYDVVSYEGNTNDFVNELSAKWLQQNPKKEKSKIIFLSYSRKDKDAVETLKTSLESINNVTCWYDKEEIKVGDDFKTDIILNIKKADLFIPLLSANSLENKEGYVFKEWSSADTINVCKTGEDSGIKNFLKPIVIDNSDRSNPNIPDYFRVLSIETVLNGNPDEKFLNDIKTMLS